EKLALEAEFAEALPDARTLKLFLQLEGAVALIGGQKPQEDRQIPEVVSAGIVLSRLRVFGGGHPSFIVTPDDPRSRDWRPIRGACDERAPGGIECRPDIIQPDPAAFRRTLCAHFYCSSLCCNP